MDNSDPDFDFSSAFGTSRSFNDWLTDKTNPLTYCLLTLDGKDFLAKNSYTVELHQKTCDHDTFKIIVPDDALDSFKGYVMEKSKLLMGGEISIAYWRYGEERQRFTGIIGGINNKKKGGSGYGDLHITGFAPSILMESGKDCQSFENKTLKEIIEEISSDYPPEAKIDVQQLLNNKNPIPYTVQYKESDYQFIKRLATLYGEFYYYTGEKYIFGTKTQKMLEVGEGLDLIDIEFDMKIGAQEFRYLAYDATTGETIEQESNQVASEFKEVNFQAIAGNTSKKIFSKKPKMFFNPTGISGNTRGELEQAVRREKEHRENLMHVKGRSRDPELRIGGSAKLSDINAQAMETYRIMEIKHIHTPGEYYNEFIGIPDLLNSPIQDNEALPKGEEQAARVLDNNDPMGMGRIRVQFPWQEAKGQKTPWIRLIQPHSGAGKGFHFIPETGEEVLVGFEGGNAEKPFVLGTHYNGAETSGYGTADNSVKVIHTRSGHILKFTEDESIILTDKSGNEMIFDTVGSNITVTAPETMTFNCKNMNINVGENMTTSVGMNQSNTVGMNQIESIGLMKNLSVGANFMSNVFGKVVEFIQGNKESKIEKDKQTVINGKGSTQSADNHEFHSQKEIQHNSGEKSKSY